MLHNTVGRAATRRPTLSTGILTRVCIRNKSEPSRHVDDFPYKHLKQRDVNHMSAEMESIARLPLRSFFAQHRPLMPFARPAVEKSVPEDNKTKWVHVPIHPVRPLLMYEDASPSWCVIPEKVAHQLGPFNREVLMNQRYSQLSGTDGMSPKRSSRPSFFNEQNNTLPESHRLTPSNVHSMLNKQFPILMQHLQKMASSGDAELHVIPLNFDRPERSANFSSERGDAYDDEIEATSVQRKRKLKMNRHKYRKRLKEQRTKRRRLGK